MKPTIKQTVKQQVENFYDHINFINYKSSLEEFLDNNPTGDEVFLIDYIFNNLDMFLKEFINEVKFIGIDEMPSGELDKAENLSKFKEWMLQDSNRKEYWMILRYKQFLKQRKDFLLKSNDINAETDTFLKIEIKDYFENLWKTNQPKIQDITISKQKENLSVHILPDARTSLIDDLIPYVDATQYEDLKRLIFDKIIPAKPIVCICEQVVIGKIFYKLVPNYQKSNWKITSDKTRIAEWICSNFMCTESGNPKALTESTILNHLKNKGFSN